jgi:hypothetical protein
MRFKTLVVSVVKVASGVEISVADRRTKLKIKRWLHSPIAKTFD